MVVLGFVQQAVVDEDEEYATALRVRLLRDSTRGSAAGHQRGLFQLKLRGSPQGGRFDPVRVHELPARPYDSPPGDQRWRLRKGDVVLQINDRRIASFPTLEGEMGVYEYVKKQGHAIELHISANRRGEEPPAVPRRIRNASLVHHFESFAMQALAPIYQRAAVTMEDRRQARAANQPWWGRRSCLGLFKIGEGGWYDTLDVRVRKLYSAHGARHMNYLGSNNNGESSPGPGGGTPGGASGGLNKRYAGVFNDPGYGGLTRAWSGGGPASRKPQPRYLQHGEAPPQQPTAGGFNLGQLSGFSLRNGLDQFIRQEDAVWLELRSVKAGCRHESPPLPLNVKDSFYVDNMREDVLLPVQPFGDTLRLTLWKGKQQLINAGRSGDVAVGKKRDDWVGKGELEISFQELKEGRMKDEPNIALFDKVGDIVGYVHLKMSYRTHSKLGRQEAAKLILHRWRAYKWRESQRKRRKKTDQYEEKQRAARRRHEERKLLHFTKFVQRRWRYNRRKQKQIVQKLTSFVEHDRALLRRPLRVCHLLPAPADDIYTPWGGRLLLYGELDAIDSLQMLFRPPQDVFYRSYAALMVAAKEAAKIGRATPKWFADNMPSWDTLPANAKRKKRESESALRRKGAVFDHGGESPTSRSEKKLRWEATGAPGSASSALLVGVPLPLAKIVGVEVQNYSEVRLKVSLASDWLATHGGPAMAETGACELVLQAHSSAAMLVWLDLLKAGIRGKWVVGEDEQKPNRQPTGKHTVRPTPAKHRSRSVDSWDAAASVTTESSSRDDLLAELSASASTPSSKPQWHVEKMPSFLRRTSAGAATALEVSRRRIAGGLADIGTRVSKLAPIRLPRRSPPPTSVDALSATSAQPDSLLEVTVPEDLEEVSAPSASKIQIAR